MHLAQEIIIYFFLFVGIYFQVFILFTYLINKTAIKADGKRVFERACYPAVTIVIPCFNEETTIGKTIESLLTLNYPKFKLKISVIDDGSIDNTWKIVQDYKKRYPQIDIHHKENGGKHTAVNYGITHATTEFVGCLDADSFVDKDTLKKIICRFDDPEIMAVTPAIKIHNPKTVMQSVQSVEYLTGIFFRKVLAILGALHVTPGPFTIYRKTLFEKIGMFRQAHNTEDMEFAFRMQANHQKIEDVHNAWVFTAGPHTFRKLYKQRVRWTHGFLRNVWDYRFLFLNKKYGNIGLLTIPVAFTLIIGVVFSVSFLAYHTGLFVEQRYVEWQTIGLATPQFNIGLFYISTRLNIFLSGFLFMFLFTLVYNAQKLSQERIRPLRILYYFVLYPIISPFWILKSVFTALFARKTSWR
jgi:cellulose synthase/poly-beta-1,6-N-acetylglucosamine synthase-like glycosyltransferase